MSLHSNEVSLDRSEVVEFPSPDQLSCDNHPFFEGLQPLTSGTKAFYNSVLSSEGDIFENCQKSRKSFKRMLPTELFEATSNLEGMPISKVTPEMLSEAEEVVEEAEKMGLRIEWFDRVIKKILEAKEHHEFEEKTASIKECMEVLQKQLVALTRS